MEEKLKNRMEFLIEILKSEPFKYRKVDEDGYVRELYSKIANIKYISKENDKINLNNDFRNVKEDLRKSILDYKEEELTCE